MKIKSQKDFWSGLMFVVVGVAFSWGASTYSFGNSARPGPGYFPFGLGVLLAVLGALILFEALTIETEDGEPIGAWGWKGLIVITVSVLVFGLLLPKLGMVISLPILVLMAAWAGDEFHLGEALFNAAILTVGSYFIFIYGLKLTIPVWPTFVGA